MNLVALDTETTITQLEFEKVRDRVNVPDLVCLTKWPALRIVYTEGGHGSINEGLWEHDSGGLEQFLNRTFKDGLVVGHNFAFDLAVLLKEFPDLREPVMAALRDGRIIDTQVLARLREPGAFSFSLAALSERYLGKKVEGKDGVQLSFRRGAPLTPKQREYAVKDARLTYELACRFRDLPLGSQYAGPDLRRHQILPEHHCDLPEGVGGFHPLDRLYSTCWIYTRLLAEPVGWEIDQDLFAELRGQGRAKMDELAATLEEHGLASRVRDTTAKVFDTGSGTGERKWLPTKALGMFRRVWKGREQIQAGRWKLNDKPIRAALQAAADDLGLTDAPLSAKTRQISTTYDFWKLHRTALPASLQAFLDYARAAKYESLYFANWARSRTGRLYPQFWIPGTETLRHASSKPNLQQVPKALRPILRVPGRAIVGADYSCLELYTLCHAMACLGLVGPLRAILESPDDPHSAAAALFAGGAPADHPKGSATRQQAKALNFGVPGGMGPRKIHTIGRQSYGLEWSLDEAKGLYYEYLRKFDDVDAYLQIFRDKSPWKLKPPDVPVPDWLESLGLDPDSTISRRALSWALDRGKIYDVHLPCGGKIPARDFCQAANCSFQALGAVVTSRALNLCFEAGLPVVAAVHDALVLAAPKEADITWQRAQLESIMERALREVCPRAPAQKVEAEVRATFF